MIQKVLGFLLLGLYLLPSSNVLAQSVDEAKQDDKVKSLVKPMEIGDSAPELKNEQGAWVNRDKPATISNDPKRLTLLIFDTVW